MELAKRFEGFHRVTTFDPERRAHPYICPAGYWTIGFGHLCDAKHLPITMEEGEAYLETPRILRRLKSLRGLSHEEVKQVFT